MDKTTTIADLKDLVAKFVAARQWEQYHTSKNLAMSIAIEAAELMEHFQWAEIVEGQQDLNDPDKKAEIGDELADILIYAISFALQADLDISEIIQKKMARNETRFPPVTG
ncbi:nucleotide pyrophosphohydrolase [bacterium]|nr:nucleotide pyrophosphohydrolase [bacterium]MCB2179148.1 nucleotide pyrophosphohydrolase [bacterium]